MSSDLKKAMGRTEKPAKKSIYDFLSAEIDVGREVQKLAGLLEDVEIISIKDEWGRVEDSLSLEKYIHRLFLRWKGRSTYLNPFDLKQVMDINDVQNCVPNEEQTTLYLEYLLNMIQLYESEQARDDDTEKDQTKHKGKTRTCRYCRNDRRHRGHGHGTYPKHTDENKDRQDGRNDHVYQTNDQCKKPVDKRFSHIVKIWIISPQDFNICSVNDPVDDRDEVEDREDQPCSDIAPSLSFANPKDAVKLSPIPIDIV